MGEVNRLMGEPPKTGLSPHPDLFFPIIPFFLFPHNQYHPPLWAEHAKQLPISP